jgi:hypothetical protein
MDRGYSWLKNEVVIAAGRHLRWARRHGKCNGRGFSKDRGTGPFVDGAEALTTRAVANGVVKGGLHLMLLALLVRVFRAVTS